MSGQTLTILAIIFLGILLLRISPGKSKFKRSDKDAYFPVVSGRNLDRKELEFPKDFSKEYNLMLIPFKRYQQDVVDTWVPHLQNLERSFSSFTYFELPTLYEMSVLYRSFLNEGMRAGIPDPKARRQTITLYLDKEQFKNALNIDSENQVHLFLVTFEGKIIWKETGLYDQAKEKSLVSLMEKK